MGEVVQIHIEIHGMVQGVSFRKWTKRLADKHSVCGWVRNTPQKTVEIVVQGTREQLTVFKNDIISRGGPRIAWIDNVQVYEEPSTQLYTSFEIVV